MSQGNNNRNDVETTNTQGQRLVAETLTCPPLELPTLPFDLLPEILCRLPVKLLVQLRCLCKFFNSLISDPKFAKKHLHMSTKRRHIMLTNDSDHDYDYDDELVIYDSPIPLPFSTSTVFTQKQLYFPTTLTNGHHVVKVMCSCDGMFCGQLNNGSYFLWNPSIRNFKLLPPLENHKLIRTLSFGYDHFIDNYKVVAVSDKNEVSVNTLGTDYWRKIEDIPYSNYIYGHAVFVSGTVNWLAFDDSHILSLDLEKESCQEICLPDFGNEIVSWDLCVLRDCLCVFANSDEYWDVWIMKEYGNKESWTKLYTIPDELLHIKSLQDQDLVEDQDLVVNAALYISEDDQLLVKCYELQTDHMKLAVYDSKTGTLNIPEFQNNYEHTNAIVYIESLISP